METPFLVVAAIVAAGIGTVALFVWRAPAGYQDRDGFHFGDKADE
jgi:hypothetical protein